MGIVLIELVISISLRIWVVMKKTCLRRWKNWERQCEKKLRQNEKREREPSKHAYTHTYTRGQCQSYSVVSLLVRRCYYDIADVVVIVFFLFLIIIVCVCTHIYSHQKILNIFVSYTNNNNNNNKELPEGK